jgi:hypothetical protein
MRIAFLEDFLGKTDTAESHYKQVIFNVKAIDDQIEKYRITGLFPIQQVA